MELRIVELGRLLCVSQAGHCAGALAVAGERGAMVFYRSFRDRGDIEYQVDAVST
jgi:hypothetical protein